MSNLNKSFNSPLRRTAIATAVAIALGSAIDVQQPVHADSLTANISGAFTILEPSGLTALYNSAAGSHVAPYWGYRTAITGTMTFDLAQGTGSLVIAPFSFFGAGDAIATTISMRNIGDGAGGAGTLVLGNMGFNWSGNNGIPVSLVWDAQGLFGYLDGNDPNNNPSDGFTSDTLSGFGALAATETFSWATANGTFSLPMGPSALVTTTWNTSAIGSVVLGDNPSGTLPLVADTIGGNPMQTVPFKQHHANFDFTSIHITSYVDTTPPVLQLNGAAIINLNVGDTYNEQSATCNDAIDGNIDGKVMIGGDTVNTAVADVYTVTYNCQDNAGNNAIQLTREVNVTSVGTPAITLLGTTPITHEAATPYTDAGATCDDGAGNNIPLPSNNPPEFFDVTSPAVNVGVPGNYPVTYECTNSSSDSATPATRSVDVVDTIPPVITLTPNCDTGITVIGGPTTPDPTPAAACTDAVDGDLTNQIVESGDTADPNPDFGADLSEVYNLGYSCTDAATNTAIKGCAITVGNPDPVATLVGDATVVIASGSDYVEEGATCEDFTDGTLADATPDMVIDGTTPTGNYTITYTCGPNSLGNTGTTTRSVIIGVAFSAAADSGSTFVMIDPGNSFVGGADDVFFSWDGSVYTDSDTQTAPNVFMNSAEPQPFFGFPWNAHNIRLFGPGSYVIPTSRGNTLVLNIAPDQVGAHMLFDWNGNDNIDVVLTWAINGVFVGSAGAADDLGSKGKPFALAVIDADGDGISGTPMADGPFADFNANFNIKLTPLFALPDASASAAQGANDPITVISTGGGNVTVTSSVNPDVNGVFSYGTAGFSYDWSTSDPALLTAEVGGPSTSDSFQFNPAGLADGAASAIVRVIDNATGITATVVVSLEVTSAAADADSDADGIPDSQDFNDNDVNPTLQQAVSGNGTSFLLESSAGKLVIGDTASAAGVQSGTYQAAITEADIGVVDDAVANSCVGGCFSFRVTGLQSGSSVDVVLPLSLGLPTDSQRRKFMNGTWREFDTTGADDVMYAAGTVAGDCPAVNGPGWSATPAAGDLCVKLTIVDGGLNDADSNANGTVVDPFGIGGGQGAAVVDPPGNVNSPSTGGCSLADTVVTASKRADWWLLAGVLAALGITRRRRQKLRK